MGVLSFCDNRDVMVINMLPPFWHKVLRLAGMWYSFLVSLAKSVSPYLHFPSLHFHHDETHETIYLAVALLQR